MYSHIALSRGTSSQCMQESRSRVGIPRNLFRRRALDTQESRSRIGLSHDFLGNRAVAQDFFAIHARLTL
eukprot:9307937-Pyramimonas_sp.AAC.1